MMSAKPWLAQYDAEVPAHLIYPDCAIQDFLIQQAEKYPTRTALICENKSITYVFLLEQARYFAGNLVDFGIKPGDRVGICLPNSIEFVIAYYGTLMAGGIVAAMNPAYPLPEWEYQTRIASPRIVVGLDSRKTDLLQLQRSAKVERLMLAELSGDSSQSFSINSINKPESFSDMELAGRRISAMPEVTALHPALLQFSGGTSGMPKAALALHKNVVANMMQFKQWLTTMQEGQEVFLTVIPLYHVYGMVIGLNVGIAMGATIVLVPDGRNLEKVLDLVQKHQVTFFPGVPSIYNAINHDPKTLAGEINLKSIKACISGSAPLLRETRLQFEALTCGKLVEGYGLSEAPTATHCNPIKGENRNGSIGLPLPDVDCKIVDLENENREVQTGEAGELLIRSPQLMQGYFEAPQETQIALKDGWLHTGDIVRMDKDGYFYIIGRRKELIKVNGLQVWPVEVEDVLVKYPVVKEAAVAGIPDDESGEAVKAWIVLQNREGFSIQELKDICKQNLASYKIPKEIEIVESLPKTPVGKILRRELVRIHREKKNKPGA